MSRNRSQSGCCKNIIHLSDLRGKPIEFRQYSEKQPPVLGTRWDCPTCGTAYFAWWEGAKWEGGWGGRGGNWGRFNIDTSYYETFNDEPLYEGQEYSGKPWFLCEDDATDHQTVHLPYGFYEFDDNSDSDEDTDE